MGAGDPSTLRPFQLSERSVSVDENMHATGTCMFQSINVRVYKVIQKGIQVWLQAVVSPQERDGQCRTDPAAFFRVASGGVPTLEHSQHAACLFGAYL